MKKFFLSAVCAMTLGLMVTSCNDDETIAPNGEEQNAEFKGAVLINEGVMGMNNASMTFYSTSTGNVTERSQFSYIGDVANDAILGSDDKIYTALSSSKTLAISECKQANNATIKQVSLNYKPRHIAEKDGYLYISCYGGMVLKFNMVTEKVEKELKLEDGENLEGVAVVGNKLYVCNSYSVDAEGNYTYLDQLLTVDLTNFTQSSTLTTVLNPNYLTVVDGHLFVLGFGDYYMTPYQLAEVNLQTGNSDYIAEATKMCAWGDKLLYADSQTDWSNWPDVSSNTTFGCYSPSTGKSVQAFKVMPTGVAKESVYFLSSNPKTNEIMMGVTDYVNTSTIYMFDGEGSHQNTFDSKGYNTNNAIFIN